MNYLQGVGLTGTTLYISELLTTCKVSILLMVLTESMGVYPSLVQEVAIKARILCKANQRQAKAGYTTGSERAGRKGVRNVSVFAPFIDP